MKLLAIVALAFFVALANRAGAATVTLGASRDNTIFQNNVNNSLGGGQAIFAGANGAGSPRRGLIGFDIAGAVPAGATITSVQLTLFLSQFGGGGMGGGGGSPIIDLKKLSADWGEGAAGSTVDGAQMTGQGFASVGGEATWTARFFSPTTPTLWTTPGGDFASTASSSLQISGTTLDVPYTWPSTSALISDVQGWLNAPGTNFGWALVNQAEGTAQSVRGFWTREGARTIAGASFLPQLTVTYTPVPEPASAMLVMSIAVLSHARRKPR